MVVTRHRFRRSRRHWSWSVHPAALGVSFMSFLNLRIGGRLYGGFGLLLAFCAALAGCGVWQLAAVHDQVKTMELQSQGSIRAGNIQIELQAVRRAILRYAFDQDEERRAAYRDLAKGITELKAKRAQLGETEAQMMAGRKLLFTDGDQMAADVQKLVDAAQGTAFQMAANTLGIGV